MEITFDDLDFQRAWRGGELLPCRCEWTNQAYVGEPDDAEAPPPKSRPCRCGCGLPVYGRNKYYIGHAKTPEASRRERRQRAARDRDVLGRLLPYHAMSDTARLAAKKAERRARKREREMGVAA